MGSYSYLTGNILKSSTVSGMCCSTERCNFPASSRCQTCTCTLIFNLDHEAVSNKIYRTIALVAAVVVLLGDDLKIEKNQKVIILF